MKTLAVALTIFVANIVSASDAVDEAKGVIASHEQFAMANDLDGVMSNAAEEIVVLTAGAPLIKGKEAFREFYAGLMALGQIDFGHEYSGAEAIGEDLVELHGVSRGTITSDDGTISAFSNSFFFVLRRAEDGKLKVWRSAFAPEAMTPVTGE